MPTTVDPLAVLADAGAHFVLVGTDKVPVMKAWQKHPADLAAVRSHVDAGGLVGVMPASLGLVAVDCDAALPLGGGQPDGTPTHWSCQGLADVGRDAAQRAIGDPLATVRTRGGGFHMLYREPSTEPVRNKKWRFGDVRHAGGFIVAWDPAALVAALSRRGASAGVDPTPLLPRPWPAGFGPARVALSGEGSRNDTLNAESFKDAQNGRLTPDAIAAYLLAATACGLDANEATATLSSAASAPATAAPAAGTSSTAAAADKAAPDDLDAEIDIARGFVAAKGDGLRCQTDAGRWFRWTDSAGWRPLHVPVLESELATWGRGRASNPKVGGKWSTAAGARKLAGGLAGVATAAADWDADPDVIGVPGGNVLELNEGVRLRRQTRADLVTRALAIAPGPPVGLAASRWLRFLDEAVPNEEVRRFLQIYAGYALLGRGGEDRALFVFGPGGSGKGTFVDALRAAFASYAVTMPAAHLMM